MRIRSIKPGFWADSKIADLTDRTKLFYIGLWGIADDAGWFRYDPREIARELYGYEFPKARQLKASRCLEELVVAGRVAVHDCGHAEVLHLMQHQRLAGTTKQVKTVFNDHLERCVARTSPQIPAISRTFPPRIGIGNGEVSEGKERLGTVTEFSSRVERPA